MVASAPEVERLIETFANATAANWRSLGRQGNVIVITSEIGDDVMITADLHGHRENLEAILAVADLKSHRRRHLILQEVCHGGPTYEHGGGCKSHQLLEEVARLKANHPDRVHFIMSNHEMAELTDYPIIKAHKMLNLTFRCGMQEQYGSSLEKVRKAYLAFLRSCPLAVRLPGDVLVCHSAPAMFDPHCFDTSIFDRELTDADLAERSSLFNMVWGRDYRPENARQFAKAMGSKVLIHGHDPCPEGFKVPNETQVILDCSSRPAAYVILPTDQALTQAEIVDRITRL